MQLFDDKQAWWQIPVFALTMSAAITLGASAGVFVYKLFWA